MWLTAFICIYPQSRERCYLFGAIHKIVSIHRWMSAGTQLSHPLQQTHAKGTTHHHLERDASYQVLKNKAQGLVLSFLLTEPKFPGLCFDMSWFTSILQDKNQCRQQMFILKQLRHPDHIRKSQGEPFWTLFIVVENHSPFISFNIIAF